MVIACFSGTNCHVQSPHNLSSTEGEKATKCWMSLFQLCMGTYSSQSSKCFQSIFWEEQNLQRITSLWQPLLLMAISRKPKNKIKNGQINNKLHSSLEYLLCSFYSVMLDVIYLPEENTERHLLLLQYSNRPQNERQNSPTTHTTLNVTWNDHSLSIFPLMPKFHR